MFQTAPRGRYTHVHCSHRIAILSRTASAQFKAFSNFSFQMLIKQFERVYAFNFVQRWRLACNCARARPDPVVAALARGRVANSEWSCEAWQCGRPTLTVLLLVRCDDFRRCLDEFDQYALATKRELFVALGV
jgi:hypothetical protein